MLKKIIYVDDEPTNRMLFEIHFRKHFEVLLAEDGAEGLAILSQHPDIVAVFSDFKMPGMNGLEFIQEAKEIFTHIPYFIVSGFFSTPELMQAKASGVYHEYFVKPYKVNQLLDAIEKYSNMD